MEEYEYTYQRQKKERDTQRVRAMKKIAQGSPLVCKVCGCPHSEILQIGHPNHDGRWHRKELAKKAGRKEHDPALTVAWVLKNPIEQVLARVQLECPYCNAWHNRFGDYPAADKRPIWPDNTRRT